MTNVNFSFKTGFLHGMSCMFTSALAFSNPFLFTGGCRSLFGGFNFFGGWCNPLTFSYPSIWGGGFTNLLPDYGFWNMPTLQTGLLNNGFNFNVDTFTRSTPYMNEEGYDFTSNNSNFGTTDFSTPAIDNFAAFHTATSKRKAHSGSNTKGSSGREDGVSTIKPSRDNSFSLRLTSTHKNALNKIKTIFNQNKAKYQAVEAATGVPAELVCAIHWRESDCNFNTYLHNGQPLGKRTTEVPVGKIFTDWTAAAIDAIKSKAFYKNVKANDIKSQYEFAERYNGTGYRTRGITSPYVWSGTNKYTKGKFTSDGHFDSNYVDTQVGVAPILDTLYQA